MFGATGEDKLTVKCLPDCGLKEFVDALRGMRDRSPGIAYDAASGVWMMNDLFRKVGQNHVYEGPSQATEILFDEFCKELKMISPRPFLVIGCSAATFQIDSDRYDVQVRKFIDRAWVPHRIPAITGSR